MSEPGDEHLDRPRRLLPPRPRRPRPVGSAPSRRRRAPSRAGARSRGTTRPAPGRGRRRCGGRVGTRRVSRAWHGRGVDLVDELASARIGNTFNQYAAGPRAPLLRARLAAYLSARSDARILLVGEAPGYRGARVSGLPFTSERQLTGDGPAEATATIVAAGSRRARARRRRAALEHRPDAPGHGDEQSRADPTRGPERARVRRAPRGGAPGDRRRPRRGRRARGGVRPTPVPRRRRGVRARPGAGSSRRRGSRAVGGCYTPPPAVISTAAFPSDDHLHRQAGRDPARLVRRRRRGEDPGPSRDADRRHAARQGEAGSTPRTSTRATS